MCSGEATSIHYTTNIFINIFQVYTTTPKPLPSQCTNYKQLSSASRKRTYGSGSYCDMGSYGGDYTGPAWYRVVGSAGSKLTENNPGTYKCGSRATGCYTFFFI